MFILTFYIYYNHKRFLYKMEKDKIKVLVVPSDLNGVGKYRSIDPHVYMQEHYADLFDIDVVMMRDFPKEYKEFFKNYDLIHVHKGLDKDGKLIRCIKEELKIPLIIDIDDHYKIGPDHPMYLTAKNEGWAERTQNTLRLADAVTTTTPIAAKLLKGINKNVYVLPNAINPEEKQFNQKKKPSERMRFGIVCGSSHIKDIELLNGIDSLPDEIKNKVQIVLCGFDTNGVVTIHNPKTGEVTKRPIKPHESVWVKYEEILTGKYKGLTMAHKDFLNKFIAHVDDPFDNEFYRRMCTRDIKSYATHYENVDVLLAPLKENDFNAFKSQLKVIEAGFTNTAIIASNYGPYTVDLIPYLEKGNVVNENGNALLVDSRKNHKDWAKYIKFCVQHPDAVEKMKNNLKEKITNEYSIENVTKTRCQLYLSLVKNLPSYINVENK